LFSVRCKGIGGAAAQCPAALSLIASIFPEGTRRARRDRRLLGGRHRGRCRRFARRGLISTISRALGEFVNVPVGVLVLLVGPRVLTENPEGVRSRFDLPGALTGTLGITLFGVRLDHRRHGTIGSVALAGSDGRYRTRFRVVMLAAFGLIENRTRHALVPLRIFATASGPVFCCVGSDHDGDNSASTFF